MCEYSGYAPTAQAVFFAGSFVGGLLLGWMADRFGRVPALIGKSQTCFKISALVILFSQCSIMDVRLIDVVSREVPMSVYHISTCVKAD